MCVDQLLTHLRKPDFMDASHEIEETLLAEQLRTAWEDELGRSGFALVSAPGEGIAGRYEWRLAQFPDIFFSEEKSPYALLQMARERAWHAVPPRAGIAPQRTPHQVRALREIVQRLARLTAIDWRQRVDTVLAACALHPFDRELRRADLWTPVIGRGLPPRID